MPVCFKNVIGSPCRFRKAGVGGFDHWRCRAGGFDPGDQEGVAVAGLDGLGRHGRGLKRGGAEAVHRHCRHRVHTGEHHRPAADVVALRALRHRAPQVGVGKSDGVDRPQLRKRSADGRHGKILGTHARQRALAGPPDGGSAIRDNDRVIRREGSGHDESSFQGGPPVAFSRGPGRGRGNRVTGHLGARGETNATHNIYGPYRIAQGNPHLLRRPGTPKGPPAARPLRDGSAGDPRRFQMRTPPSRQCVQAERLLGDQAIESRLQDRFRRLPVERTRLEQQPKIHGRV